MSNPGYYTNRFFYRVTLRALVYSKKLKANEQLKDYIEDTFHDLDSEKVCGSVLEKLQNIVPINSVGFFKIQVPSNFHRPVYFSILEKNIHCSKVLNPLPFQICLTVKIFKI